MQCTAKVAVDFQRSTENMKKRLIFISYSHDSPAHKQWVAKLAGDLQGSGIDVILDQWDLRIGDDFAPFAEQAITRAENILLICTPNYILKSNEKTGGVGWEKQIITGALLTSWGLNTNRVIPVVREVKDGTPRVPIYMQGIIYADFCSSMGYQTELNKLINVIQSGPQLPKWHGHKTEEEREKTVFDEAAERAGRAAEAAIMKHERDLDPLFNNFIKCRNLPLTDPRRDAAVKRWWSFGIWVFLGELLPFLVGIWLLLSVFSWIKNW